MGISVGCSEIVSGLAGTLTRGLFRTLSVQNCPHWISLNILMKMSIRFSHVCDESPYPCQKIGVNMPNELDGLPCDSDMFVF